jgi:hypothetical protein
MTVEEDSKQQEQYRLVQQEMKQALSFAGRSPECSSVALPIAMLRMPTFEVWAHAA